MNGRVAKQLRKLAEQSPVSPTQIMIREHHVKIRDKEGRFVHRTMFKTGRAAFYKQLKRDYRPL